MNGDPLYLLYPPPQVRIETITGSLGSRSGLQPGGTRRGWWSWRALQSKLTDHLGVVGRRLRVLWALPLSGWKFTLKSFPRTWGSATHSLQPRCQMLILVWAWISCCLNSQRLVFKLTNKAHLERLELGPSRAWLSKPSLISSIAQPVGRGWMG